MRALAVAVLTSVVSVTSCAPAPLPVPVQSGFERDRPRSHLYSSLSHELPYPVDDVFRAVSDVYAEIGFRPNMFNLQDRVVGNSALRMHRTFAGARLARYFTCGASPTGDAVNNQVLTVDVRTQVRHLAPAGAQVVTWISAGAGAAETPCTSTGAIEKLLVEQVRRRLAS